MNNLEDSIKKYKPASQLASIVSRRTMALLRKTSFAGMAFSGFGAITSQYVFSGQYAAELLGVSLIFGSFWLEQMVVSSYHNSYYFQGLNSIIGIEDEIISGATYDVADAVLKHRHDVTFAFCSSTFGSEALFRAGMPTKTIDTFLRGARQKITAGMVMLPENEIFSLIGLGKYLLKHDFGFKTMLKSSGVSEDIFLGSLRWVVGNYHQEKRDSRWWGKDNLSKTTGIGREWSYGSTYILQNYARNMDASSVYSNLTDNTALLNEKVKEIETRLSQSKAANVMIIGEPGVGKTDLIVEIERRIKNGTSLNAIAGKKIIILDTSSLFASHRDKQGLESNLIRMFNEAASAGNIIVVIENISNFIKEAESIGVLIPELLDPYLAFPDLQIITTDTPSKHHAHTETFGGFIRRFSEVFIDSADFFTTTRTLQSIALREEFKHNILFTYPGLHAITTSADRYVVDGVMPDKAITLMMSVITAANQAEVNIITEDFVQQTVSEITGVPVGPIKDEERELLLHLEDNLHLQVVGQDTALSSISSTMRRARAGIQSAEKPIGSFLFLGPTGVGKTETAKALANIFFGGEDKLQRIDMSEFSGPDSLTQLIGSKDLAGVLSNLLREHPYCVLLLDEFEKADQSVHDLFLQILDEGGFTDARGTKINARNVIIIATSNAGSKLILRTVKQRQKLSHLSQEIIDHIVKEGIYRPELINRFDNAIIFEPLNIEQQTEVARLMFGHLYERMREKGYEIDITDDLLNTLVKKGYNPEFGARPIQRILQDIIEEKIAQKIISGDAVKGDKILLSKDDFVNGELD